MARSKINVPTTDLVTDTGSVLWSFIKGEQLEFPITLKFLDDATSGYTYEAVVIEADNANAKGIPSGALNNGVQSVIVVRVPVFRGTWDAAQAYNREEVVLYNGVYYRLFDGLARINSGKPDVDATWITTQLNKIYVRFPNTLGATWVTQPTVAQSSYGFFELRVTENSATFPRTWKPVRGLVEIQFSPTDLVP
jgi:hypothetical protein